MTGTGGDDNSDFLGDVGRKLKTLNNIHCASLSCLPLVTNRNIRAQFVNALCQFPIVRLELLNLDPLITKVLLEKLPETMHSLKVKVYEETTNQKTCKLLSLPNLTFLQLHRCAIDFSQAFLPNIKDLTVDTVCMEPKNNATNLVHTISRMPKLEFLHMNHIYMRGIGALIVKVLKQQTLKSVFLQDCNLSVEDGGLILESIWEGKLDHINKLNLWGNKDLTRQNNRFEEACSAHNIQLVIFH